MSGAGLLGSVGACLLLPGCFTTMLWGGYVEEEEVLDFDHGGLRTERSLVLDPEWEDTGHFFSKLLFTPVTLAADILTSPVQAWFFDDEDEDFHDDEDEDD